MTYGPHDEERSRVEFARREKVDPQKFWDITMDMDKPIKMDVERTYAPTGKEITAREAYEKTFADQLTSQVLWSQEHYESAVAWYNNHLKNGGYAGELAYMNFLNDVAEEGNDLIREKTKTYGASWKKRGGAGAWFTTVRPWDRLEHIVAAYGGDVFMAIAADPSGSDGSALACIRDIRNYLTLIEAETRATGLVSPS